MAASSRPIDPGSLPTSLDALVPGYLPQVPRDPFVDAPLPSAFREPEGARVLVINSVGPDGDDVGGEDIDGPVQADSEGDIAFVLTVE